MKKLALPTPLHRRGLGVVVLLLTAVSLFTFRTASAQEADHPKKRMSIAMTNASLDDVLQQIKHQTGYLLLYNSNEIKAVRGITINRQQAPVEEILREVLKGSGFDFSISEDTIVIRLGERPLNSPPPTGYAHRARH